MLSLFPFLVSAFTKKDDFFFSKKDLSMPPIFFWKKISGNSEKNVYLDKA